MIHFNKKIAVVFAFINSYSLASFAGAYFVDAIFPPGFYANYILQPNGEIVKANNKSPAQEIFNKTKNGDLDWSVKSEPCAQNKSFQCVGVYIGERTKVNGNQVNPFSAAVSNAGFTMLKINPKNGEQNSVIKCKSKFIQNMVRDEGKLANCFEYSKEICQNWRDYINKNKDEFRKVVEKVEECTDVAKSLDKINKQLKNTFQNEIKQSEKNIFKSYDATTHPERWVGITTESELTQDELKPSILTYKDIFDRTSDCQSYAEIFMKGYSGTASTRLISSDIRAISDGPGAKSGLRDVKGRN